MTTKQRGFSAVEVIVVVLVIALIGGIGWLVWSRNSSPTASPTPQPAAVEIPELGVKITDPENRGIKVFYDDTEKANCLTNENYYPNNRCAAYAGNTHCVDKDLTDAATCQYFIYDNTTYKPNAVTSTNVAPFAKYYQCDSDLVIYATSPNNIDAQTDFATTVKVNNKSMVLWAHGASIHSTCTDTEAANTDTYMKNFIRYVKENLSAL